MKKLNLLFSALLLCMSLPNMVKGQSFVYGPNLILNPSFEDAQTGAFGDAFYQQHWLPQSQRTWYVVDWIPGYTYNSNASANLIWGSSPDLYDYSINSIGCNYADIPNRHNNSSTPIQTQPVSGTKYAFLEGGYDPPDFSGTDEGESILGRFQSTLCPGNYEVSLFARVPYHGWCNGPLVTPSTNSTVEVALRITGDHNSEILLTTTPQLTQANWYEHKVIVNITAAQIAAGYDRIEFRMSNQGGYPHPNTNNEVRTCFIDSVGLRMRYPATPHTASTTCDQTIDLTVYESACNGTITWEDAAGNIITNGIASPGVNTVYYGYCRDANGCITHVDIATITVTSPTIGNFVYEICQPKVVNPPNTCGQAGAVAWSWTINGVTSSSLDGTAQLSPGDQGSVTITYANGCVCTTNFTAAAPLYFDIVQPINACYGQSITLDAFFDPIATNGTIDWNGLTTNQLSRTYNSITQSFTVVAEMFNQYGCLLGRKTFNISTSPVTFEKIKLCKSNDEYVLVFPVGSYDCSVDAANNAPFIQNGSCQYTFTPGYPNSGDYIVKYRNANGDCITKIFQFSFDPDESETIEYELGDVCEDELLWLTADCEGQNVEWDNGSPLEINHYIAKFGMRDQFTVRCLDDNGCVMSKKVYHFNVLDSSISNIDTIDNRNTPILLCEGEIFNPPTSCPNAYQDGTPPEWYIGEEISVLYPIENVDLLTGGIYPTHEYQAEYSRVFRGPGPCDICQEIYSVYKPYSYGSPIDFTYIDDNKTAPDEYTKCDDCFDVDLSQFPLEIYNLFPYPQCSFKLSFLPSTGLDFTQQDPTAINIPGIAINGTVMTVCPQSLWNIGAEAGNETSIIVQLCFECNSSNNENCTAFTKCFEMKLNYAACKKGGGTISSITIDDILIYGTSVEVYPNPSTGIFTLELTGYNLDNTSYTILDAVGREIMKTDDITSAKTAIDLSTYEKGIYFIRIQEGEAITTKKIIIQ